MWFKFLIVFVGATLILGEHCDHLGVLLYEDLGCTPHYDKSQSCPTKYYCLSLEPDKDKCYFRGKGYEDGEHVDSKLSTPTCDEGCFCSTREGKAKFTCVTLDCPEWLRVLTTPNCYRTYSLEQCCSTGENCENQTKCSVDGTDYEIGLKFYPANTCLECVCQENFENKYEEPFCRRRTCGVQLRHSEKLHKKCAPLYVKDYNRTLCCPESWICADGTEEIKGDVERDDECTFGETTLKIGQRFEKVNVTTSYGRTFDKVKCQCVIPPLLTCNKE